MTLKECYQMLGGDYAEVTERLHSEAFVRRCVAKFVQDTNFDKVCAALAGGNCEAAFRAMHTFKSLCHSLAFCRIYPAADSLTEALRAGQKDEAVLLLEELKPEYSRLMGILRQYQESAENS